MLPTSGSRARLLQARATALAAASSLLLLAACSPAEAPSDGAAPGMRPAEIVPAAQAQPLPGDGTLDPAGADLTEWKVPGQCDASALHPIGPDAFLFAVDENNSLRSWSAVAGVREWANLHSLVEGAGVSLSDREIDIEAVAALEDRLLWIGSHGLNRRGRERPNRRLLLATSLPGSTGAGTLRGQPVDLLPALLDHPELTPLLTPLFAPGQPVPPKKGGLNIEALASDGQALLVGLRSPLDDEGRALLLGLGNPLPLLDSGAEPEVSVRARLDLGGRGLRAMARLEDRWLLVAGPVGSDGGFALYEWRGSAQATWLRDLPAGFRPEGLAVSGERLLFVSDDGKVERSDGTECGDRLEGEGGDHPDVFFRVFSLPVPGN